MNTRRKNRIKSHGLSSHRYYQKWVDMMGRCTKPNHQAYKWYGAIGIDIQESWLKDPTDFIAYISNLPNEGISKYSIDRIDNSIGYFEGNLRWTSQKEQINNRRLLQVNNTTGYNGVSVNPSGLKKKYRAVIYHDGKQRVIGRSDDPIECALIRNQYILDNLLNMRLETFGVKDFKTNGLTIERLLDVLKMSPMRKLQLTIEFNND